MPTYIVAGPDKNMWCTELGGNRIARITMDGVVTEFPIPREGGRPIALAAGPDRLHLWFTEEAGGKVGRINMEGEITEFPVPLTRRDAILAGLAFDQFGHLWVQQYLSPPATGPTGNDYLVRLGGSLATATHGDLSDLALRFHRAPSQRSIIHRIVEGPDHAMWFTELGLNRLGRIAVPDAGAWPTIR